MMDIVTTVKAMIDAADVMMKADDKIKSTQLGQVIVEFQKTAMDAELDLRRVLREKEEQADMIRKLEKQLEFKDELFWKDGLYWVLDEADNGIDPPYCTCCYDTKKQAVKMSKRKGTLEVVNRWQPVWYCHACKNEVLILQNANGS
jgi:hypothetical protein